MVRGTVSVALCLLLFASGCEKKEPEQQPPVRVVSGAEAPRGMAAISPGAEEFITEHPVSVGQYVEYLEETGQAVPPRWEGMRPGTPGALAPVTGLERGEAELYATWALSRLPEPDEWARAADIVGARPYPWAEDGSAVEDAALFLVRDWQPGSEGEQQAQQRREDLPERILARYRGELDALRERVEGLVDQQRQLATEKWDQLKPALFNLLDKKKELAECLARRERRAEVLEILKRVLLEKGKLAARLKTGELGPEEARQAVQAYDEELSSILAQSQEVRQNLEATIKGVQEQVVALTRRLEESAAGQMGVLGEGAQALLEGGGEAVQSVRQAVDLQGRLRSVLESLQERAPGFEELPDLEDLKEKTAQIEQKIRQAVEDEKIAEEMDDVRARIESVGQTIEREFLKEKLVIEELLALVDLRARKEAIEATLEGLKEALGEPSEPEQQ